MPIGETYTESGIMPANQGSSQHQNKHFTVKFTSQNINEYVLREVKCRLEHGLSQPIIETHLKNVACLLGNTVIPNKWSDVL